MADRREHVPLDNSDLNPDEPADDSGAPADTIGQDGSALTSTGRVGGLGNTADIIPRQEEGENILDTDAPLRDRDTELPD